MVSTASHLGHLALRPALSAGNFIPWPQLVQLTEITCIGPYRARGGSGPGPPRDGHPGTSPIVSARRAVATARPLPAGGQVATISLADGIRFRRRPLAGGETGRPPRPVQETPHATFVYRRPVVPRGGRRPFARRRPG